MKIKYNKTSTYSLTCGKAYEVLSIEREMYRIIDDTEGDYLYPMELFDIIEE